MPNNITHVQAASSGALGTGTSITTPAFTAIGSGNSIIGAINSSVSSTNLASVTDNASGNTYVVSGGGPQFDSFGVWYAIFYGVGIINTPTTLTFHFTGNEGVSLGYAWDEYTKVKGILVPSTTYQATLTTTPSIAVAPPMDNCTMWSFINPHNGGTITAGSGFSLRLNDTTNGLFTEDGFQGAHAATNATWNDTTSTDHFMAVAALQSSVNRNALVVSNETATLLKRDAHRVLATSGEAVSSARYRPRSLNAFGAEVLRLSNQVNKRISLATAQAALIQNIVAHASRVVSSPAVSLVKVVSKLNRSVDPQVIVSSESQTRTSTSNVISAESTSVSKQISHVIFLAMAMVFRIANSVARRINISAPSVVTVARQIGKVIAVAFNLPLSVTRQVAKIVNLLIAQVLPAPGRGATRRSTIVAAASEIVRLQNLVAKSLALLVGQASLVQRLVVYAIHPAMTHGVRLQNQASKLVSVVGAVAVRLTTQHALGSAITSALTQFLLLRNQVGKSLTAVWAEVVNKVNLVARTSSIAAAEAIRLQNRVGKLESPTLLQVARVATVKTASALTVVAALISSSTIRLQLAIRKSIFPIYGQLILLQNQANKLVRGASGQLAAAARTFAKVTAAMVAEVVATFSVSAKLSTVSVIALGIIRLQNRVAKFVPLMGGVVALLQTSALHVRSISLFSLEAMSAARLRVHNLLLAQIQSTRIASAVRTSVVMALAMVIVLGRRMPQVENLAIAPSVSLSTLKFRLSTTNAAIGQALATSSIVAHRYLVTTSVAMASAFLVVNQIARVVRLRDGTVAASRRASIIARRMASNSSAAVSTYVERFYYVRLSSSLAQAALLGKQMSKLALAMSPSNMVLTRASALNRIAILGQSATVFKAAGRAIYLAPLVGVLFVLRTVERAIVASSQSALSRTAIVSRLTSYLLAENVVVVTVAHAPRNIFSALVRGGSSLAVSKAPTHVVASFQSFSVVSTRAVGKFISPYLAQFTRIVMLFSRALPVVLAEVLAATKIMPRSAGSSSSMVVRRLMALGLTARAGTLHVVAAQATRSVPHLVVAATALRQFAALTTRLKRYLANPLRLVLAWMNVPRFILGTFTSSFLSETNIVPPPSMGVIISSPSGPFAAGSTAVLEGKIVDSRGNGVAPDSLTLTIVDSLSGATINGVSQVNVLNVDRGVVSADGLLTLTLEPADMVLTSQGQVQRSLILDWSIAGSSGRQQVNFVVREAE